MGFQPGDSNVRRDDALEANPTNCPVRSYPAVVSDMAHISIRQTSQMCQRLGTSLRAGVDVRAALQRESGTGGPAYRQNMGQVADRVNGGATLAEALRSCGNFFPELTCELTDVGETTGNLESVLLRLSDYYQHLLRLRKTFVLGIFWPALELVMAVCIVGLLIWLLGVIGNSAKIFGLSGARGAMIYAVVVLGGAALIALAIRGLLRGWFGSLPSALLMRLPVVGKTLQTMALARLSWTLSLALDAGIDAGRAIRMGLRSTQNRFYTEHIDKAEAVIMRHGQFHEALQATGVFRDEFLSALETAEVSGTESESLTRLSQDYQSQAETSTLALTVAASVAIWILVAALIIYMVFYLFMNLYMKPINEALEMMALGRAVR
jgi:type IV pilus assembly protein PilC